MIRKIITYDLEEFQCVSCQKTIKKIDCGEHKAVHKAFGFSKEGDQPVEYRCFNCFREYIKNNAERIVIKLVKDFDSQ